MEVFSAGNLITFFAVLLILVIFRALDRNNRSLEKLKRFSDKIAANISALVEEKTVQIREFSEGLQGSLAVGKELMARTRSLDEALQARTAEVEAVRRKVLEYERNLGELGSASKKVREESEIVETVGRRIGETAVRLEKLEKRLPELDSALTSRARQILEATRKELLSAVEGKVGALVADVGSTEKKLKDFSAYMVRLEAREEQAEKERATFLSRALESFEADLNGRLSRAAERGQTLEEEVFRRLSSKIKEDEAAFAKSVEAIEMRLADYQSDVDYRVKSLEDSHGDIDALRGSLRESMEKMAGSARAEMTGMAAELIASWQTEISGATKAREQIDAGLAEVHAELEQLKTKAYQDVEKGLSVFEDEFFADLRKRAAQALDKYQAWQADMDTRIGAFEGEMKSRMSSSDEVMQGLQQSLRAEVEKARRDSGLAVEKETAGLREALDGAVRRMQREIETRLRELTAELEAGRKDLGDVLDASRTEVLAWEGRARQQLSETEVSVAEKISRLSSEAESSIETVREEFVSQKEELLSSFSQERAGIKGELKEARERIFAFEAELKQSAEATVETIRAQAEKAGKGTAVALEKELAGLKEALESRTTEMHARIDSQMEELASHLETGRKDATAQADSALAAVRESFASGKDNLVASLGAERETLKKQIADMEQKIGSFDAELSQTTDSTMEAIQVLQDSLHAEVEKARKESLAGVEKDLASLRESLDAGSRRMQKEIETRMGAVAAEVETNRKEVTQLLEASSAYITAWEGKARQRLSESEAALGKKLASLEAQADKSLEAVQQVFAAQKEELVTASEADRAALRSELAEMAGKIATLKGDLAKSSEETLAALRGQADVIQAESQKRIRDFQGDIESRIKEYRQMMTESREKAEAMQEKLSGKVEESYRLMTANLLDIEKRVKGFTTQTRLFERADSLKSSLEASIEEMKKELAKLGAEKADLAETELQLARTRKLADEVSAKLSRFLSEKRRIDEMEGEFKKLLTLSRDIDLKVDTLSGSHDALQQIQAKVREFEEMGKVVESGVERLDKKQQIISVTTEGVDKNFQRLESMEKAIKETDQEAAALDVKVKSLLSEYEALAGRKKDAETAIEIAGKLTGVIEDLEQRLDKAQSSREWLARTETRFEEIGRQAQEQVRLLESIVKSETKKEKGERGAPPMDKRETVVKLSHQGWSVQEISRVTQLSRGEVELILELAPKV